MSIGITSSLNVLMLTVIFGWHMQLNLVAIHKENKIMKGFRLTIEHYSNPLHIMCRLINIGFSPKQARTICHWYETHIFKYIYRDLRRK